jgi:hypothetical protein
MDLMGLMGLSGSKACEEGKKKSGGGSSPVTSSDSEQHTPERSEGVCSLQLVENTMGLLKLLGT